MLVRLRGGDEIAFRELVMQFRDKVFNTALGLVQHHTDAEDIAQEVFIQVYHSIHQFKGDSTLGTWVYRIAVNKSLDFLRSKKRKKRFGFITNLFGENNEPRFDDGNFQHPGVQAEQKEDAALLFKCIALLPESQKTAFILNKVEDLSYHQIAAVLNTTEAAVDSLLQRAKQNLRKKIGAGIK